MPIEAAEENGMKLAWCLQISALVQHVIQLVRILLRHVRQCDARERGAERRCKSSGGTWGKRPRHQWRNTRKFINRMFAPSSISAVGIWTLMTAYSSGSSSSAVGTMLKLAAIGVISVPQNPASIPIAAMTVGSPPNLWTISGSPIPAVITVNAAKALPMIIVNTAIPSAYVTTTTNGLSSGIQRWANPDTTAPTPAIAKSAPSAASI